MKQSISSEQIIQAHKRIKPFIYQTPILSNKQLDTLAKCSLFFKPENLQKTGSFKVRGAANKILQLEGKPILCAHSSGNHAQAVAYIAQQKEMEAHIIMPIDTPMVKQDAVKQYGANIVHSGPTQKEQEEVSSNRVAKELSATFVHPYNDQKIIAGAATCALEIYEELKDLDYLLVPIGGGGLSSGTVLSTYYFSPKTQVIGVQPFLAGDAKDSLEKGSIQPQYPPLTLAEGVRVNLGEVNFPILKKHITDVILVSQAEMIEAAKLFLERMKMVVEISGATVLAAVLKDNRFRNKKVAAIISGGNMDFSPLVTHLKSKAKL